MNTTPTEPQPSAPPAAKTPTIALVSFILGLSTFVLSIFTGIPALICGHIALAKIKRSPARLNGKGLAITGLVLGYLSFLGFLVVGGLAALMFPGVNAALSSAKKAEAASSAYNLKNAISSYYIEYRKYPVPNTETMEDGYLTDEMIMNVLVNGSTDLNPRKIAFFTGRPAKPVAGDDPGKKFENGISEEGGNSKLWDPWGNLYRIAMDLDQNNKIKSPAGIEIPASVIVWSSGPDGVDGTEDDVKTW